MGDPEIQIAHVSSPHYTKFTTGEGQLAYTLTGVVVINEKGDGSKWRRFGLDFDVPIPDLPPEQAMKLIHWAVLVTPNSIANDQAAIDAGWAVDDFHLVNPNDQQKGYVRVMCELAVRDVDGLILRLGYFIQLLGILVPSR
jgi:hypothetical protein